MVKNRVTGENTVLQGITGIRTGAEDTMISLPGLLLIPYRFSPGLLLSIYLNTVGEA